MADTILILGNGFDIAMGRKTKYTDFIEFEKYLYSNPDKELQEFLKFKGIDIDKYRDNLYLKFINENRDILGKNWSNLEIMISNLADAIMYFKENSDLLYVAYYDEYNQKYRSIEKVIERLQINNNYGAKLFILKSFLKLRDKMGWRHIEREYALEQFNNVFIEQLDLLIELLELYLSYIDYLDFEVRNIGIRSTALDVISDLSNSSVLNFNYTNTTGHLFDTSEERTHFIHGRIDLDRTISRINTMVFGIEDKENNVNSDLIPYQKYYQRVLKETGNQYEEFFKRQINFENDNYMTPYSVSKNIVIFGHSVDPLDKEIFQKCFELGNSKEFKSRFIFTYYDEFVKRSVIKNLAIIIGKDKLVELTGKKKVVFVQSGDIDRMRQVLLP
ncbi:AbiH family protein [Streptococcus intermedius]